MTLNDIEKKQAELLAKVQALFENKNRTQKQMDELYQEIKDFEKEKGAVLYKEIYEDDGQTQKDN